MEAPIVLTDNDFFTGLSNLALHLRLYATNTSNVPDEFVNSFMTETLSKGNTKIFPWADLPTVSDYNETSSLLTVTKVNAGEEYLQITEKKVIKSSYSRYILDMAFTDESGMNNFIGYLLGQMESAKISHLYDVIVNDLFTKTFTGTQLIDIDQYDLSSATSLTDLNNGKTLNQKEIAEKMQLAINNIAVYNTQYNELGNKQALDYKDLRIIFVDPYKTQNVIDLMATLLRSDVLDKDFKKPDMLTIPTSKIPQNNNTIAFIMHRYAYQMFYKFVFMGTFFDVSNLCINNFLHFWYGKGWLKNLPAIKFDKNVITLGE